MIARSVVSLVLAAAVGSAWAAPSTAPARTAPAPDARETDPRETDPRVTEARVTEARATAPSSLRAADPIAPSASAPRPPAPAAPLAFDGEPALPPLAPGREIVVDSSTMLASGKRILTLSDIDPETAEIVREINSKPGTWQMYLLYTAEDLPERMFHPGFAIRIPDRQRPVPPELPPEGGEPQRKAR